jgi:hypothetical protein
MKRKNFFYMIMSIKHNKEYYIKLEFKDVFFKKN